MEQRVNYTLVGLFVVILGLASVALGYWLSFGERHKIYRTYLIYFEESVAGLTVDSPVKFNGVDVGYVKEIILNQDDPKEVQVMLRIEQGTPITEATEATLESQGITGIRFISLRVTAANSVPLRAKFKQKYPVINAKPSLMTELDKALRDAAANVKAMTMSFRRVFDDDENVKSIKLSLRHIAEFSGTLAKNSEEIDRSLKTLEALLTNAEKTSTQLPLITKKLEIGLDSFNHMSKSLQVTSEQVALTMKDGRVSMQQLSQQIFPSTQQLIARLDSMAANLEQVSKELQQDPSIILRGKVAKQRGPGE